VTTDLAERIRALPGMDRLLPALDGLAPAYLVGGAVRDLLRGADAVDLDLAVEGDAREVARELAARLGGDAVEHERFGTATVKAPELGVDLATTRRETYSRPGALPDVEPASLADDLVRRDFTINAMAAGLNAGDVGRLHAPHGGRDDLEAGVVRVLHSQSFIDDPTRLLRAVRYEVRLGFRMDPETERLARHGDLSTVSGARVRDELMDLLREPEAPAALARLAELGLDRAMHPALRADAELAASAQLGTAEVGADPALAALASMVASAPDELEPWVEDLHLGRAERDAVMRAARKGPQLARALAPDLQPSAVHALLSCEPPEALAVALALGAPADPVLRYVADMRGVSLEISGADLLDAGVPESPAIGRALAETLKLKLDGRVNGREEELRTALEIARSGA
jgi:tRNA nucleotidyltransferase (CCA-adding enzyme)